MRIRLMGMLALAFCLTFTCVHADGPVKSGGDWPQWRGPERNAISTETGLLREWPKAGPKLLWDSRKVNQNHSVGTGFSSVAIANGKLFTMGDTFINQQVEYKKDDKILKKNVKKGTGGFVFCLDAETGKQLWQTKVGVGQGDGPRCTPTVDGGRVYSITRQGNLTCINVNDGAIVWQKDFKKDFDGYMMSGWDYSESPTIDGDKLICTPGGQDAALVALNKLTGEVLWKTKIPTKSGAAYASIVTTEAGGVKQYITLLGREMGLVGVDANNGKFLWNYKRVANGTANIPTAIVKGELVFTSTGYNTGSALLKLLSDGKGGVKVEEEYFLKGKDLQNHHGGMVMLGDYIYGGHGHNNGLPFCLAWKTGKFAWDPQRGPGGGSAAVLYADGHLYFRYESGTMALIEASPKGYNLKSFFQVPISGNGWPHPVIYHGRLYLRGADQILCYDIKQH